MWGTKPLLDMNQLGLINMGSTLVKNQREMDPGSFSFQGAKRFAVVFFLRGQRMADSCWFPFKSVRDHTHAELVATGAPAPAPPCRGESKAGEGIDRRRFPLSRGLSREALVQWVRKPQLTCRKPPKRLNRCTSRPGKGGRRKKRALVDKQSPASRALPAATLLFACWSWFARGAPGASRPLARRTNKTASLSFGQLPENRPDRPCSHGLPPMGLARQVFLEGSL